MVKKEDGLHSIIRCRQCKYYHEAHYEDPGDPPYIKHQCKNKYGLNKYTVRPDEDYCSRAEKRERETGGRIMERVSDAVLEGIINGQGNIIAGSWNAIHYLLVELQARRKAEKEHEHTDNSASEKDGAGATQEREKAIDEFWMKIELNCTNEPCSKCPASDGDVCGFWEGTCGRSLRKKYESIAGANVLPGNDAPKENTVLPIPCTKACEEWSIKDYFQKINEELDELKEEVLWFRKKRNKERIAEEAADTITAITSILEAMGINEQQRQAAQRRVNGHNRQRGRC